MMPPDREPRRIHIELPAHLAILARVPRHIDILVPPPVTQRTVLDALEANYPMLQGTIRGHATGLRRPFLRFFACLEDISHAKPDDLLPDAVALGHEPLLIVGSISGG